MQRRGRDFWTRVVDEYEGTPGESHAEFATRHRVAKATFERWLYLLRAERSELSVDSRVRLLPVQVDGGQAEPQIVVELGDGLGLRVSVGTDPGYVATLVKALRPC